MFSEIPAVHIGLFTTQKPVPSLIKLFLCQHSQLWWTGANHAASFLPTCLPLSPFKDSGPSATPTVHLNVPYLSPPGVHQGIYQTLTTSSRHLHEKSILFHTMALDLTCDFIRLNWNGLSKDLGNFFVAVLLTMTRKACLR